VVGQGKILRTVLDRTSISTYQSDALPLETVLSEIRTQKRCITSLLIDNTNVTLKSLLNAAAATGYKFSKPVPFS